MSDVRNIIQRLFTAYGQDATTTSTTVPGSPAEIASFFAFSQTYLFNKTAADGAAGTATSATFMFFNPMPYPVYVLDAKIVSPAGTLTASDTDYATINILTDDAAAGTPTAAVTQTTKTSASGGTGNWAAAIAKSLMGAPTAANSTARVVPAGGAIWYSIAKAGSGVVVPISTISVTLAKF